jgi:hypothetical protein
MTKVKLQSNLYIKDTDGYLKMCPIYIALKGTCECAIYIGHQLEPDNLPFMSSCTLYTGSNYMHYSLNRENETVLYRFIYLPFKAGLTVLVVRTCYKQVPFKAGLTVLVVRTCYKQVPFKAGLTVLVVRTCYKQVPFKEGLTVLVVRTCYKQVPFKAGLTCSEDFQIKPYYSQTCLM